MKDFLPRALSRHALLPLSLLVLSCGGGTEKPPPKDPPQTSLTVPKPNTAGQKLTVQVSATGCDQIQSLSIYDQNDFLKSVPYSGGGFVPVDLGLNEIKYTRGIAVQLSLKSRVVCTDGRQGDSQAQAATFFPAAEVVEAPPGGGQIVTDNFVAESPLPLATFLGCGNAEGGVPVLFHVNKNGGLIKSVRMPFLCTNNTVITPRHAGSGVRWVWTPDAGAISVDANLTIKARVDTLLDMLVVGPDGDALIYDAGAGGSPKELRRVSYENGTDRWPAGYSPRGFLITPPVARGDDIVLASITSDGAPSNRANILTTRVDYGRLNPSLGGREVGTPFLMKQVASSNPIPTEAPPTVFSPDGDVLYMAFTGVGNISEIFACVTNANGCTGASQRWAEIPSFPRPIVAMVPYAAGSRLAAISPQAVWFLDTGNGGVTNKGGASLTPEGALVVLQVQTGGAQNPQAFYILNGPAPQEGLPSPQPLEIVATDDPAKGELYRYSVASGSLSAALDDAGTLWLRVGGSLVRPLTPGEYRQVRPVTP